MKKTIAMKKPQMAAGRVAKKTSAVTSTKKTKTVTKKKVTTTGMKKAVGSKQPTAMKTKSPKKYLKSAAMKKKYPKWGSSMCFEVQRGVYVELESLPLGTILNPVSVISLVNYLSRIGPCPFGATRYGNILATEVDKKAALKKGVMPGPGMD